MMSLCNGTKCKTKKKTFISFLLGVMGCALFDVITRDVNAFSWYCF